MTPRSFKLKITRQAPEPPMPSSPKDVLGNDIFSRGSAPVTQLQLEIDGHRVNLGVIQHLNLSIDAKDDTPKLEISFVVPPGEVDIDVDAQSSLIFTEAIQPVMGCFGFVPESNASTQSIINAIEKPGLDPRQVIRDTLDSVSKALEPAGT